MLPHLFTRVRKLVSIFAWTGKSYQEPPFTTTAESSPGNAVQVISQTLPHMSTHPLGAVPSGYAPTGVVPRTSLRTVLQRFASKASPQTNARCSSSPVASHHSSSVGSRPSAQSAKATESGMPAATSSATETSPASAPSARL